MFIQLNQFEKAINFSQKAIQINPKYAEPYNNLGLIFVYKGQLKKAITFYEKAILINPKYADAFSNMGLAYRELKEYNKEIDFYNKAIEIQSNHANAHYNLGVANQSLGNFQKAIYSYKKAAEFEPENLIHYYHLVALDNEMLDLNLKDRVNEIMRRKVCSKRNLAYGNFLISKYELKKKDYEKEFDYLLKGHFYYFQSKKEKFEGEVEYFLSTLPKIQQLTDLNKFDKNIKKDNYKIKPIFIFGVPRCGSTLVEKIIASGNHYIPIGEETGILSSSVKQKIIQKQPLDSDLDNFQIQLLEKYRQKGLIQKKNDFTFTDKDLGNFFHIDLIKQIFPYAKAINCKRDPLSSIMSIVKN